MVSLNTTLIRIDQICDFLPYVSTATNATSLIFYSLVKSGCFPETIKNNSFANHLYNKNKLRCITLLVPFYGNSAVAIYSLFTQATSKEKEDIPDQQPVVTIKRTKTNDEKKADYVTLFLDKIGPYYCKRFDTVNEACKTYLRAIDFDENRDANEYGQILITNLELLLKAFVQEINYISFNSLVLLNRSEKDQLLADFLNSPEMAKQREDLRDQRNECIGTTRNVLEIMKIKPREELLNRIIEILEKLSNHDF